MASSDRKHCIVIAGPNGAGKSTSAPLILGHYIDVPIYVNADVIARGLSGLNPDLVAADAGQVMLDWLRRLVQRGQNFAFETTLSGRSYAARLREIAAEGYFISLFYLWIPDAELSATRVRKRVASGGHGVPLDVIHRRYLRSLRNFFELYAPLADIWVLLDNSHRPGPEPIAYRLTDGKIEVVDPEIWQTTQEQIQ